MKRNYLKFGVLSVLLAGGITLFCQNNEACSFSVKKAAAQNKETDAQNYNHVVVYSPQAKKLTEPYSFNAELQPEERASIFARANGYIEEQFVDIGTKVQEGDILAKLSSPELEDQLAQAKEEITKQKAELKYAESLYNRIKGFRESGAVAISEIEKSEAEKDMARASLNSLQARLSQLKKEFGYTEIKAPFDGIVIRRNVNRGDRISVSDNTAMYELAQSESLRVVVRIPQTLLALVNLEQDATLSVQNQLNEKMPVHFKRQSGAIDETSGTLRVEYSLNNKDMQLPSGLTGKIYIEPSQETRVIMIPSNAVQKINGNNFVMAVTSDQRVVRKPVLIGDNVGGDVILNSGISIQDRVILNPNALLQEGDKVIVKETHQGSII